MSDNFCVYFLRNFYIHYKSRKIIYYTLEKIAKNHSEEGYNIMFKSGYGGEHWLATFAIYNFSK